MLGAPSRLHRGSCSAPARSPRLPRQRALSSPTPTLTDALPSGPAPEGHAAFRGTRVFGSLDGIRALSILAVVWHHAHGGVEHIALSTRGYLGVDMFFVLSGFLIVTLLLRERDKSGTISFGKFYARRSLRIFPLYYALLALLAVALLVKRQSSMAGPFFDDLPYLLTYTSNWVESASILAIAWSLATEEQFYLVWPPIEKFLRGAITPILVAALAFNQAINFGLLDGFLESVLGLDRTHLEILQATFTPILLGVALAHLLHSGAGFALVRRLTGFTGAPVVYLAATLACANWASDDISGLPRLLIQLSMTGLLAASVVKEHHMLRGLLSFRPLVRIGVVSYGMYLLHMFCLHGARVAEGKLAPDTPLLRFALCTLITWGVAEVSFRFFEGPVLRFKERFATAR